jgi:hypothetical protein
MYDFLLEVYFAMYLIPFKTFFLQDLQRVKNHAAVTTQVKMGICSKGGLIQVAR